MIRFDTINDVYKLHLVAGIDILSTKDLTQLYKDLNVALHIESGHIKYWFIDDYKVDNNKLK